MQLQGKCCLLEILPKQYWYWVSEELMVSVKMRLILAFQRLQKQYDQTGKPLIYTAHTVTVSSHIHQHVSAGEPDKQHSHRGDWWSVDNPGPIWEKPGALLPCSRVAHSPLLAPATLTHSSPSPVHGSRQRHYRGDRNSHALMLSEDV